MDKCYSHGNSLENGAGARYREKVKKKRRLKVAERSNVEGENGEWIAGVEGE